VRSLGFLSPLWRPLGWWVVSTAALGCSENYGTPPVPPGTPIAVQHEQFAGPILPRAGQGLAGTGNLLWVATDRGLYHAKSESGTLTWRPAHFGVMGADGFARVSPIVALAVDPTGRIEIHAAGFTVNHYLTVSIDGGRTFRPTSLPNVIAGTVERVAALPPSEPHPGGAFAVVQGVSLFLQSAGSTDWTRAELPSAPLSIGPLAGNTSGEVVVAVETGQGWALWASADGGARFEATSVRAVGPILDVAITEQGIPAYAAADTIVLGASAVAAPPPATFIAADLGVDGERVHYLARLESPGGVGPRLWWGTLPDGDPVEVDPPDPGPPADLLATAHDAFVLGPTCDVFELDGPTWIRHPFGGGHLNWGAIATDPNEEGALFLGSVEGRVWREDAAGAASVGQPNGSSQVRALLEAPRLGGLFAGTYGVQWRSTGADSWQDRSAGLFNYRLDQYSGPVDVQTLALDPSDLDRVWLGSTQGNGPYRSRNGGQLWEQVHGGLGSPGSIFGEDGLPAATDVRAFVLDAATPWMGTYRGGVWRLDPRAPADPLDDVWVQSNRGLPDLAGEPVDTCCFAPLEVSVDVRDLTRLADGTLLAATGWGIFRDEDAAGAWEPSSDGLTNYDVFALAVHPTSPDWVLAAARGTAAHADWIFLSEDGGRSWSPLASVLRARFARDVVWSAPSRLEVVALLDGGGAWRMELSR
jgi:hypothetical protein